MPRRVVDCASSVSNTVDASPIRSPQAVHSWLANNLFSGKDVVEIGTRYGDGMACYVRTAATATFFEAKAMYCKRLTSRLRGLVRAEEVRRDGVYRVNCTTFGAAGAGTIVEADYYEWWMGDGWGVDRGILRNLCRFERSGEIRPKAEAVVLFDMSRPEQRDADVQSLNHLRSLNITAWETVVAYDEEHKCRRMMKEGNFDLKQNQRWCKCDLCLRARGSFVIAGVPILRANCDRLEHWVKGKGLK